jgi:hypothetical protein
MARPKECRVGSIALVIRIEDSKDTRVVDITKESIKDT